LKVNLDVIELLQNYVGGIDKWCGPAGENKPLAWTGMFRCSVGMFRSVRYTFLLSSVIQV